MEYEKSCGGVIFQKKGPAVYYLIIKHKEKDGGHWDFPKGHVENGESEQETALREIYEEVELKVKFLDGFREEVLYFAKPDIHKTVVFFLCKSDSSEVKYIFDELESHAWLTFKEALKRLTFENCELPRVSLRLDRVASSD